MDATNAPTNLPPTSRTPRVARAAIGGEGDACTAVPLVQLWSTKTNIWPRNTKQNKSGFCTQICTCTPKEKRQDPRNPHTLGPIKQAETAKPPTQSTRREKLLSSYKRRPPLLSCSLPPRFKGDRLCFFSTRAKPTCGEVGSISQHAERPPLAHLHGLARARHDRPLSASTYSGGRSGKGHQGIPFPLQAMTIYVCSTQFATTLSASLAGEPAGAPTTM